MGLSPPRSTTMMLQSPDKSKINVQQNSQHSAAGFIAEQQLHS